MWCKRYAKVIIMVLISLGIVAKLSTHSVLAKGEIIEETEGTTYSIEKVEVVTALYKEETIIQVENTEETETFVEEQKEKTTEETAEEAVEETAEEIEEIVVEPECYACTLSEAQVSATKAVDEDDSQAIKFLEELEDGTRIYSFNGREYTIPDNHLERDPMIGDNGYIEQITDVPHYIQQSYPKTKYGGYGTISSHGCGITSCAMVFSYLLDYEIRPDELAEIYGNYNTKVGSAHALFDDSAKDFNLAVKKSYSWIEVEEGLQNGCVVIANVKSNSIFTDGGHFIVYYGITEDGKILVKDPSIYNYGKWSSSALKEGFQNGFDSKYCRYSFPCWIYYPKNIDMVS